MNNNDFSCHAVIQQMILITETWNLSPSCIAIINIIIFHKQWKFKNIQTNIKLFIQQTYTHHVIGYAVSSYKFKLIINVYE